jgi:hypothetical protein
MGGSFQLIDLLEQPVLLGTLWPIMRNKSGRQLRRPPDLHHDRAFACRPAMKRLVERDIMGVASTLL